MGLIGCLIFRNTATVVAWRRMAELLDARGGIARGFSAFGGRDGAKRQVLVLPRSAPASHGPWLAKREVPSPQFIYRSTKRISGFECADLGDDDVAQLERGFETAIANLAAPGEKFGSFEAMFALACRIFRRANAKFAVFEAGIGGPTTGAAGRPHS